GADLQRALQAQRRDAVLLRGEHPARREPHGQRRPPAIEECPCRHRCPAAAGCALVAAIGRSPPPGMPAPRADEALRPPQPVQIIQAVSIGPEPGLELSGGPRVVHARPMLELIHGLSLVRSDEYPRLALCRDAAPGRTWRTAREDQRGTAARPPDARTRQRSRPRSAR